MLPGVITYCKIRRLLYFPQLQGVLRVGDSAQPGRERVPVEVHLPARQRSLLRQLRRHLRPHRNSARAHEVSDPNLIMVTWSLPGSFSLPLRSPRISNFDLNSWHFDLGSPSCLCTVAACWWPAPLPRRPLCAAPTSTSSCSATTTVCSSSFVVFL